MITSTEVNEIFAAMVLAQSEIESAKKTSDNPYFKSKYADLAEIISVSRRPLSKNGLAVIQSPNTDDFKVMVTTRIIHKSGQWIEDIIACDISDKKPQAVGSCITYLRRYSLSSLLGIAQEDDDGNESSKKVESKNERGNIDALKKLVSTANLEYLEKLAVMVDLKQWTDEEKKEIEDIIAVRKQELKLV